LFKLNKLKTKKETNKFKQGTKTGESKFLTKKEIQKIKIKNKNQ
jgi:hypothetical protein